MERGEQLNLRPVRGRGRGGKGGRGRGGKQTKNDKDKHDGKEDQQTWTDDMEKAWNDFKAERQDALDKAWFEEYGEQDGEWIGDLGKEEKAWDRYAHHDSKVSMHSLKQGEEIEKVEGEKTEKKDRKEKRKRKRRMQRSPNRKRNMRILLLMYLLRNVRWRLKVRKRPKSLLMKSLTISRIS